MFQTISRSGRQAMSRDTVFSIRMLVMVSFLCILMTARSGAAEPTLARLAFQVPPDQMATFESIYSQQVAPFLKQHGLVESPKTGRPTPDTHFTRLFEMAAPSEIAQKDRALRRDRAWRNLCVELGTRFGSRAGRPIQWQFSLYTSPAGPGKVVVAGPGKVVTAGPGKGQWRTFDRHDWLGGSGYAIFQDRSLDAGCDDFLPKPVEATDLLEKIGEHLELKWIYEDAEQDGQAEADLVVPSGEALTGLFEAAKNGQIRGVQAEVDRLANSGEMYGPFMGQVQEMVGEFQLDELCDFLKPFLESRS